MLEETPARGLTRRELFLTSVSGFVTATMASPANASEDPDDAAALINRLTGKTPTEFGSPSPRDAAHLSERLHRAA